MGKASKKRASKHAYISQNQLTLEGFETPFAKQLRKDNRWVILADTIPWDEIVWIYLSEMNNTKTGAEGINPRVVIGSLMIKHICNLSDRETVQQIQENMYMQYFIGYSSFSDQEPFDPSLFVEFRKRLSIDKINELNEKIIKQTQESNNKDSENKNEDPPTHKGKMITDATACPQDIAYPTDLNILNDAREKSEQIIDALFEQQTGEKTKPRTYRKIARKKYLETAQKKKKSKNVIRKAVKKQLSFLRRNIKYINNLLDKFERIPLQSSMYKYWLVIQQVYDQQRHMYDNKTHSVDHRIVSIHQPHVRPIVRGKTNSQTEFGLKINVSLMNGFVFLDQYSWEAFNEGVFLMDSVELYKERFGYYPEQVLADKIYCTRENRRKLKELKIELRAKPLGRPKAVATEHVSPGERNPIEGKFGQGKKAYGLDRINARTSQTSKSWVASIILILNLVKLAGQVSIASIFDVLTFSANQRIFLNLDPLDKLKIFFDKQKYSIIGLT